MAEYIDRLVKKLPRRSWDQISSTWLKNLPSIEPPGKCPTPIIKNEDLIYYCEEVILGKKNKLSSTSGAVAGLRAGLFHEGVYWLHKSAHALCGAESKVALGMLTWSVIDAYLAAFFSMRSISAMLGVAICDYKGRSCVIDICRDFGDMRRDKREGQSAFAEEVSVHTLSVRFDHKQCWQIFRRLLRVVRTETWGQEVSQSIRELQSTDFAHHRNQISYYVHEWLEDDLHQPIINDEFATKAIYNKSPEFNTEDSDFTLHVAYSLLSVALTAYQDIAKVGRTLKSETEILSQTLGDSRHPYYGVKLRLILSTT